MAYIGWSIRKPVVFKFFGTKALCLTKSALNSKAAFPMLFGFQTKPLPSLAHSAGTSQNSGASLACEPCLKGEYQDQTGQQSCKRCDVGDYQDEEGGPVCKKYLGGILLRALCGCHFLSWHEIAWCASCRTMIFALLSSRSL